MERVGGHVYAYYTVISPLSSLLSLLQLVASLGKQYIVWQEIFDNGLQVLFMWREQKTIPLKLMLPHLSPPLFTFGCYTSTQIPTPLLLSVFSSSLPFFLFFPSILLLFSPPSSSPPASLPSPRFFQRP